MAETIFPRGNLSGRTHGPRSRGKMGATSSGLKRNESSLITVEYNDLCESYIVRAKRSLNIHNQKLHC